MGGSAFPSYGKSPAAAAALGKPTLKQAKAFRVPSTKAAKPATFSVGLLRVGAMAHRAGAHANRAIPRGHVVRGVLKGHR